MKVLLALLAATVVAADFDVIVDIVLVDVVDIVVVVVNVVLALLEF